MNGADGGAGGVLSSNTLRGDAVTVSVVLANREKFRSSSVAIQAEDQHRGKCARRERSRAHGRRGGSPGVDRPAADDRAVPGSLQGRHVGCSVTVVVAF